MSKSIYEAVLEIVDESLYQPDNSVIFNHLSLNLLKKSLEQAKKHEKVVKKVIESISRAELSKFQIMSILSASIGVGNEYDDINLREFEKDEQ